MAKKKLTKKQFQQRKQLIVVAVLGAVLLGGLGLAMAQTKRSQNIESQAASNTYSCTLFVYDSNNCTGTVSQSRYDSDVNNSHPCRQTQDALFITSVRRTCILVSTPTSRPSSPSQPPSPTPQPNRPTPTKLPTATPTSTPGNASNCTTDRFKVKGFSKLSNGVNIRSVKVAEIVYANGTVENLTANSTNGEFSLNKCWGNVPQGIFKVRPVAVAGVAGTFKPDGNPGKCTIVGNEYRCNTVDYLFTNDSNAGGGFTFKATLTNTRPNCTISGDTNETMKSGQTKNWTFTCTDAENDVNSAGAYFQKQPVKVTSGWSQIYWTGNRAAGTTGTIQFSGSNGGFTCPSNSNGEKYEIVLGAKDNGLHTGTPLRCSGNPTGTTTRCASGKDKKIVTCNPT